MVNIWKIPQFQFRVYLWIQFLVMSGALLLHILISFSVLKLAKTPGPAGVGDMIALITIPVLSLVSFSPSFKYLLAQGITRKKFFWGASATVLLTALAAMVLVVIFYLINLKVSNVIMLYSLIYHGDNILGLAAWEFGALFFLAALGWFICLVYYVSNLLTKYVVTIIPFVLGGLLILFDAMAHGAIGRGFVGFLKAAMGITGSGANPFIGMSSMLAATVVVEGLIYLLIRRASIKD
jgi:hypothetical protein